MALAGKTAVGLVGLTGDFGAADILCDPFFALLLLFPGGQQCDPELCRAVELPRPIHQRRLYAGIKKHRHLHGDLRPLNLVFPLCLALLLQKAPKMSKIFGLLFLLPLVIPSGSVVHFWKSIWDLNGLVNRIFYPDAPVNWLNTNACRTIITIVFLWKNAGYNMVLFLAGLRAIPKEYYECAAVEGAGAWGKFYRVTLPCIVPTAFLVFILSIINSFKSFKEIYLICGAYPHQSIYMLQHFMNNQFSALNYQKLTAGAYVLSLFIVGLVLILYRFQNKRARDL